MENLNMRLWKQMILLVEDYLERRESLKGVVNKLENALDASNIDEIDHELYQTWYEYWTPLEITLALMSDSSVEYLFEIDKIDSKVEKMKFFLMENVQRLDNDEKSGWRSIRQ